MSQVLLRSIANRQSIKRSIVTRPSGAFFFATLRQQAGSSYCRKGKSLDCRYGINTYFQGMSNGTTVLNKTCLSIQRRFASHNAFANKNKAKIVKNEGVTEMTDKVRLVWDDPVTGENQWAILSAQNALEKCRNENQDLVLVSANSSPPVCKMAIYGQVIMQKKKKSRAIKANARARVVKELLVGATIDPHDLGIKMKKVREFLDSGHQVKVSVVAKRYALQRNPLALDETTLQVLELVEETSATAKQQHSNSPNRREFIFSPAVNSSD
jgi:translation initiation factor IF-3